MFGMHFFECVWATPIATNGTDCCVCSSGRHREYSVIKLVESKDPEECGVEAYTKLITELIRSEEAPVRRARTRTI